MSDENKTDDEKTSKQNIAEESIVEENNAEKKDQSNEMLDVVMSDREASDTNSKSQENIEKDVESKNTQSAPPSNQPNPAELFSAKPMPRMKAKKTKRNWLMPMTIALLIIIALAASGWSVYQQSLLEEKIQQNLATFQSNINNKISSQSQAVEAAKNSGKTSLDAANQAQLQLQQMAARNQQLAESLLSTQEKIKAVSGRKKQDWMLAEAAYLIKVAQLQLTLQKDKGTAIQLLKTADSRIVEIADNTLLPIREGIAKDISDLSLIMEPDLVGMSYALDAINQQIPQLTLTALEFQQLEESVPDPSIEEDGFSLDNVYQKFLKDFVVIKDHSDPRKPLMTPDQRVNLDKNIQLAIQQAQIALAQGQEGLYQLNLSNAIKWIEEYFDKDERSNNLIGQLRQLSQRPVETHYPNQLNAKTALDEISRKQLYRWLESSLSNSNSLSSGRNNFEPVKNSFQPIQQPTQDSIQNIEQENTQTVEQPASQQETSKNNTEANSATENPEDQPGENP